MSRAERDKGARGEREVAELFRSFGWGCDRTPNSGGLRLRGDLYGHLPLHVEVKRQETARPWAWAAQAKLEADGQPWAVAFRRDRGQWLALVPLEQLLRMIGGQGLAARHSSPPEDE